MPARKGEQVLKKLGENSPEIWHQGERVQDVTTHPAFKNGLHSLARLYDVQWEQPDVMLFDSPTTGEKVGRSFMIPRTQEELSSISRMMKVWANFHHGMMGRAPDYLNRALTAYAGGADFLSIQDPRFTQHVRDYHEYLRESDLCMTHTLITPQANRAKGTADQADPYLAARVKEETDAGLVIRGARMLATLPTADEIMVFPSTLLRNRPEDSPYAFGLSIATHTPGLKFVCRETMDYGRSQYDHPLGSRFEEMDAVVIFDDVFVPWERVFLYRDVEICNQAYTATGAIVNMAHQVVVKNIAKTEFLLGLASLMTNTIGIEVFQHVQEKLATIWINLETMKAFLRAAEVDAALDEYGVMRPAWNPLDAARNLYPHLYPRMV
ncbi:MAG TPA: 4-hydroxyphenylacetate 3-monooxygenase, oxygenase component, partial [Anaerolineales bacterium]|nr:4-hydroxyphenylacetate 3-monooxygenase, oxygenase component [Anaerolineales bacterium]